MASATYLWLLCLLAAVGAAGDDSTNRWVTPPVDGANHDYTTNPQYTVGDRVQLEWRTNATGPVDVFMFQDNGENKGAKVVEGTSLTTFTWTVTYGGLNKSLGNAFWFELYGAPVRVASHYFFINDATTTTASSTPTAPAPTGTTSSTPTAPAATGTTTPPSASGTHGAADSTAPETGSSMGRGTVAGIAVGASLGGLAVVALVAFLLVRARKRRPAPEEAEKPASQATTPTGPAVAGAASQSYLPLGEEYYKYGHTWQQYEPAEMSSARPPAEMTSDRPPAELFSYQPPAELDGVALLCLIRSAPSTTLNKPSGQEDGTMAPSPGTTRSSTWLNVDSGRMPSL